MCGAHFDDLAWAINVWASAIGRKFHFESNCTNPHIKVFSKEDPFAMSECQRYKLLGREYTQYTVQPMQVVDCGGLTKNLALHEAGHLFGLCDQYPGEIAKCGYTTAATPGSVMQSAVTDYLTSDDLAGIKGLAAIYSPSSLAGKILASGTYDRSGGGFSLNVTTRNNNQRTTSITLALQGQSWTYNCNEAGMCGNDAVSLKILSSNLFEYTWQSTTRMNLVSAVGLMDDSDSVVAAADNVAPPGPVSSQLNFNTGAGQGSCVDGSAACDKVGAQLQRACVCSYLNGCLLIESVELCTNLNL